MDRLAGKVALITGGARGQGAAEVRLFVREGARVVFSDILDEEGEKLAAEVGDQAVFVHHDVRSEADWERVVAEATTRFGRLDVLVNNAGVLSLGKPTHLVALEEYMRVVEINQVGVFLGMRAAIPAMLAAGGGSIVNISSTSGLAGLGGTIAYAASKFAVRGMTKTAAMEYGAAGIRVNSVHPGGVDTAMTRRRGDRPPTPEEEQAMFGMNAIPRIGQPDEVASLVLFLASDESRYCTGSEFVIDGGMVAGNINPRARVNPQT
jgi:3alpha(or 20beta)-hydroxysteroid dehydrogenase